MLQSNIFGAKRPNFLNYASFGSIVAYAISSAFSLMSKDKKRNSVTLEDEIYDNFLNRTKCIEDQYKMVHNETRNYENIINSLVADMISMRASYLSYKDWSKRHIDELGLPFLRFTPNQLFWIRLVQNHCNKDRSKYLTLMKLSFLKFFLQTLLCGFQQLINKQNHNIA